MQKRQNIHNISTHWTNQDEKIASKLILTLYIHSLACTPFAPSMSTDRLTGTYRTNKKFTVKPNRRWIQNSRQKYYTKVGLLKRGFPLTASWRLKKILRVPTLSFNAKHCWRHTSGTVLSSATSDRGGSPRLPTERSSRDAERRGTGIHWRFVHDGAPAHILSCSSTVMEQLVSWTPYNTVWPAHHRCNICGPPFQSASPALATAGIECGSRGFTASEAT